jgi:hypothetical protein
MPRTISGLMCSNLLLLPSLIHACLTRQQCSVELGSELTTSLENLLLALRLRTRLFEFHFCWIQDIDNLLIRRETCYTCTKTSNSVTQIWKVVKSSRVMRSMLSAIVHVFPVPHSHVTETHHNCLAHSVGLVLRHSLEILQPRDHQPRDEARQNQMHLRSFGNYCVFLPTLPPVPAYRREKLRTEELRQVRSDALQPSIKDNTQVR